MTATFSDVLEKTDVSHDSDISEETDVLTIPEDVCIARFWLDDGSKRITTFFHGPVAHYPGPSLFMLFPVAEFEALVDSQICSIAFSCDHYQNQTLTEASARFLSKPWYVAAGDKLRFRIRS